MIELISLELSNRCAKACWFCYNHSSPAGAAGWAAETAAALLLDCARHGVQAVSLGGGEPLESPALWPVLAALRGVMFRSLTTNGLLLDEAMLGRLVEAAPEKIHVSVHFPEREEEVERAARQVCEIEAAGIRSGVNLLVDERHTAAATRAARRLNAAGIGNDRIIYLPMRVQHEPTPQQVADVAGSPAMPFQSTSCLRGCAKSPRFVSLDWKMEAAWCSYTSARRRLQAPTHAALMAALEGLELTYCGAGEQVA